MEGDFSLLLSEHRAGCDGMMRKRFAKRKVVCYNTFYVKGYEGV